MSVKQQKLVLAIIDFLNQSIQDGTVKQDDREGLEVAVQCIGEAFGVDPSDSQQTARLSVKPASLQNIFDVFLKTREKATPGASGSSSTPSATASSTAKPSKAPTAPSAADKMQAEKLKASGNTLMSSKQYDKAIEAYTQAIALDGTNVVYYSNRAAAQSSKGDHHSAIADAEKAIEMDPAFARAYHRLGHAHYSLGNFNDSASAFRRGLEIDPTNANMKSSLANAEARIEPDPISERSALGAGADAGAGMGGLADMLGAMGGEGRGGGGGMPDLAGMMQNPMMMQMAQQMMANGGLERMMQNPTIANMMNRVQSGGGIPSMAEIMADPSLREMAGQFMGGGGRGGPPPGPV